MFPKNDQLQHYISSNIVKTTLLINRNVLWHIKRFGKMGFCYKNTSLLVVDKNSRKIPCQLCRLHLIIKTIKKLTI